MRVSRGSGQVAGERHPAAKLNWTKVDRMRWIYAKAHGRRERRALARAFRDRYGVSQVSIWNVLNHVTWRSI